MTSFLDQLSSQHSVTQLKKKTLYFVSTGLLLSILAAFTIDQYIAKFWNSEEIMPLRKGARAITDAGASEFYFVLAVSLYIFTKWVAPRLRTYHQFEKTMVRLRIWSVYFFWSLLSTGFTVQLIKFLFGRQRPHKSEIFDPMVFAPLNHHWHFHSFPSGHTQVLFTVATLICILWPKGTRLVFLIAAILAFTRVITHNHFVSDLIGGFLVGYLGTLWTVYFLAKKPQLSIYAN